MNGPVSRAGRLYRVGLRLLPKPVRTRHGAEMTRAFDDEWADCHGHGRARFLARAGMGLVASALLYRIDHWRLPTWGPDLRLDLRLAARSLLRRRRFVGVVVLTLTVGVGLNTAVFSLVNGLLVRPLPYLDAHELVQLSETAPGIETMDVSLPDFAVWRASSQVFTGMFAFDDESFLLAGSGRPEIVEGARVTPGFLDVLGLMPTLGRRFMAAEERPGAERVALISDALWERRFGRDPAVIGRSLVLDGVTHEVVGVVPANFHFPEVAQVWVPLAFHATEADPDEYGYDVIARLRPDRDLEAARQEGVRVASVLAERFPETKGNIGAIAYPIRMADIPAVVGGTALLLLAAVSLVLLVACTNAATLLMARGDARRGEMAVRRALGADGSRLFRQVMTETSVIALLGVAGALVAAHVLVDLLPALLPGERPFWVRFDLDHRVFLWTAAMGVVAVLVMGLPPVLQALRGEGAGRATRHATPPPGRRWLVGMQIAMATTLVAGAALSTRALLNLNRRSVGLNDAGVLVLAAPIPPWRYPDHGSRTRLTRSALESVRQLPGVTSAATVGSVPFLDGGGEAPMEGEGAAVPFPPIGVVNLFSDDYFATLEIPVRSGRIPAGADVWTDRPVAVVGESLARRLWPGEDAVGKRVRHGVVGSRSPAIPQDQPWLTVVAVVGDVSQAGPAEAPREQLYLPMGLRSSGSLTLLVRGTGDPLLRAPWVMDAVRSLDAGLAFHEPTTMTLARRFSVWTHRMATGLLSGFALLAMFLALVGIYGILSYLTRQRDREIGVRVALGAVRADVVRLVLRDSLHLMVPGLATGLVLAGVVSVAFERVLFEVGALDPVAMGGTGLAFLIAGLLAGYLPARRAAGINPAQALGEP